MALPSNSSGVQFNGTLITGVHHFSPVFWKRVRASLEYGAELLKHYPSPLSTLPSPPPPPLPLSPSLSLSLSFPLSHALSLTLSQKAFMNNRSTIMAHAQPVHSTRPTPISSVRDGPIWWIDSKGERKSMACYIQHHVNLFMAENNERWYIQRRQGELARVCVCARQYQYQEKLIILAWRDQRDNEYRPYKVLEIV